RQLPVRARVALADDEQAAPAIAQRGEPLDRGPQPFALEPTAGKEDGPGLVGDAGVAPGGGPVTRPVVGMKALEVHAVIYDAEPGRSHAVQPRDLLRAQPRD